MRLHYTTTEASAIRYTCAFVREINSVVYERNAENEPVSRIKIADYRKYIWERYSYLRNEAIIRKTPFINTSEHYTVCLVCRLVARVADEGRGLQ